MRRKPIVMVSSSAHQITSLLDQIYGVLEGDYTVWMSHKHSFPVFSDKSNFDNCLEGVERCDLFLGLITPYYGTGVLPGELGITHREMLRAIELDKPRWFLAHDHVVFARQILRQFRFCKNNKPRKRFAFHKTTMMDDIRVIDMYEAATRQDVKLDKRTGNWVQPYFSDEDALRFIDTQFGDVDRIKAFLKQRQEPQQP